MKLTYWVAENTRDSQCYNIRTLTKKECLKEIESRWNSEDFDPPRKVVVEYDNAFDLLTMCLSEGSVYEGE